MKPLRIAGIVVTLAGCLTSSCAFLSLSAESLPYQDAPRELLLAQARSMEALELTVAVGLGILVIGLVLLWAATRTAKK